MSKKIEENNKIVSGGGNVTVSENVIATVVKNAVTEIEGVYSISGEDKPSNFVSEIISNKTKNKEKSIKIITKGKDELAVEISVVLKFGTNVIEISKTIQEKVKEAVESLVGMHVKDVDVYIDEIEVI